MPRFDLQRKSPVNPVEPDEVFITNAVAKQGDHPGLPGISSGTIIADINTGHNSRYKRGSGRVSGPAYRSNGQPMPGWDEVVGVPRHKRRRPRR